MQYTRGTLHMNTIRTFCFTYSIPHSWEDKNIVMVLMNRLFSFHSKLSQQQHANTSVWFSCPTWWRRSPTELFLGWIISQRLKCNSMHCILFLFYFYFILIYFYLLEMENSVWYFTWQVLMYLKKQCFWYSLCFLVECFIYSCFLPFVSPNVSM